MQLCNCDNCTVCLTWPTWYSYVLLNFFHPWMAAECREEVVIRLATVCEEWRQCVHWSVTSSPWRSPHPRHHVYHTLLHPIVSVGHPACSVIGQSMHLTPVHMGLTFARLFAITTLWSCKMYFAFIYACKWTNTVSWIAVTYIRNKTKHWYTVQR